MDNRDTNTIIIPKQLFGSLIETQRYWERFSDELEDFLIASDKILLKKVEKSRKEHLAGKTRDIAELKAELG